MEKQMMIRCPKCGAELPLDADVYNSIADQVQKQVVADAVSVKEKELLERMASQVALAKSQKDLECKDLLEKKDKEYQEVLAEKDADYKDLHQRTVDYSQKVNATLAARKAASEKALAEKDTEIATLKNTVAMKDKMIASEVAAAVAKEKEAAKDKDVEIASLRKELESKDKEKQLALSASEKAAEAEMAALKERAANDASAYAAREKQIRDKYEEMFKMQKEELDRIKDFKSRQTVKLLGEDLEKHCANAYGTIRALMPTASFEKDNTVSTESHSKGDFIFRDIVDGQELTSVMFEMKNEADDSQHKHKNEDYFRELDKDRREKNCEYAILVSTLEPENELYNGGIVDVSYAFPKMYVIRPQAFIPVVTMLYGLGRKTYEYKRALAEFKKQNIDVTNFEADLDAFKKDVMKNRELANKSKTSAIDKIDKTIAVLQSIKADFEAFDKHMSAMDGKAEKMTIRKLTKNAPGVLAMMQDQAEKVPVVVADAVETVEAAEPAGTLEANKSVEAVKAVEPVEGLEAGKPVKTVKDKKLFTEIDAEPVVASGDGLKNIA